MNEETVSFRDHIQTMVEDLGEMFEEPSDDWNPMLFFESPPAEGEEKGTITVAGITGEFFANAMMKDRLVVLLAGVLQKAKATRFALLLSAWGVRFGKEGFTKEQYDDFARKWGGRFQEHPDRYEMLVLLVADSADTEMWTAEISRFEEQPPTLGEWSVSDAEPEGRFVALASALQCDEAA